MCGICGILNSDERSLFDTSLVRKMASKMMHRGPDDEGFLLQGPIGLGVRRLSVIDLVTGHQPISNETNDVWTVLNGEIFNYQELRKELKSRGHIFRTNADTEVLVHLYEDNGPDCVQKLNGEFAFAIWDAGTKRLIVARDRFGIKPLFYRQDAESLIFASELKAILPVLPRTPELDPLALEEYLALQYIPHPNSIFKEVKKLPPGFMLICENKSVRLENYWSFPVAPGKKNKENYYMEQIGTLLEDSVKLRLASDVPLGVFLSGGLDSSLVAAFASKYTNHKIKTFSIGFDQNEFNELRYAKMVAERFNTDHTEMMVSAEEFRDMIVDVVWYLDEPFADSSSLPTFILAKIASEDIVVALGGDGGDELFAGYDKYTREQLFSIFRILPLEAVNMLSKIMPEFYRIEGKRGRLASLLRSIKRATLPAKERYCHWNFFFNPYSQKNILLDSQRYQADIDKLLERELARLPADIDEVTKMLFLDLQLYLPGDLLVKLDRMSMANSLEVRVPFLDYRLAEFAGTIPSSLKVKHFTNKYILKKAVGHLLPKDIVYRKKQGFAVPLNSWLKGNTLSSVERILTDKITQSRGYFNQSYVKDLFVMHKEGNFDHAHRIWSLLVFEIWCRLYLDNNGNYDKGLKLEDI